MPAFLLVPVGQAYIGLTLTACSSLLFDIVTWKTAANFVYFGSVQTINRFCSILTPHRPNFVATQGAEDCHVALLTGFASPHGTRVFCILVWSGIDLAYSSALLGNFWSKPLSESFLAYITSEEHGTLL